MLFRSVRDQHYPVRYAAPNQTIEFPFGFDFSRVKSATDAFAKADLARTVIVSEQVPLAFGAKGVLLVRSVRAWEHAAVRSERPSVDVVGYVVAAINLEAFHDAQIEGREETLIDTVIIDLAATGPSRVLLTAGSGIRSDRKSTRLNSSH